MPSALQPVPLEHADQDVAVFRSGVTEALARFAAGTKLSDVPEQGQAILRGCLLDFIGNSAFAAARAESSPAIRKAVAALDGDSGPATAIGEARGYSWHMAALLNGTYAHTLDFDDTNQIQTGHPGAPVIAAALAEAERLDATADAFFAALAVGYEVCCRIGGAIGPGGYDRGFHITAISGIFGAVAAVSKLRGLAPETIGHAFGLALSRASGSMQYLDNGSWNKRIHPGFAAHDAIICVTMAEAGVIGAAAAIEGRYGVLTSFTGASNPRILTEGLGSQWTLLRTAIKPYPSCRLTHAAIDAAIDLRKQFAATELPRATIRIALSPVGMKIVGERSPAKLNPRNTVDAQFSVYFQVAAAWLDGRVDWSSYERLGADDILGLTERISVQVDPGRRKAGASFVVELDGEEHAVVVDNPLGEPERPLGWEELKAKFLSLATPVYGVEPANRIEHAVKSLEPASRIRAVIALLRIKGGGA